MDTDDFDAPLDVWSFKALERLQVHEARTQADLGSCVVRTCAGATNRAERDPSRQARAVTAKPPAQALPR
jgi:hypothetical protein